MVDPFGRALRDFHRDELAEPLIQRDGPEEIEHPIEELYFGDVDLDVDPYSWLDHWLDGPLLDLGAGVGRHTLAFQDEIETVAVEVSEHLVETMRERGVAAARVGDMFALAETFPEDRFESVLLNGTQASLAGSRAGLEAFLDDLACVTTASGSVVLDSYDPTAEGVEELLGYRSDAAPGLAFRVMHFEYEGSLGQTLLFRLFSPEVLRDVAASTPWTVAEIDRPADNQFYFRSALEKR